MRRFWIVIFFVFVQQSGLLAQEFPIIGQYLFNEMVINPASTGNDDAFKAQLSFRKQWLKVDGAPTTQNLSLQAPLFNQNMAVGVLFYRDQIGVSNESGIMANYAYRLSLPNDGRFVFGVGGGMFFQRIRYSQLTLNQSNDPNFIADTPLGVLPNFSAGVRYETKDLEVGLSVPMLMTTHYRPDLTGFQLQHRFSNYNYLFRTVYNSQLSDGLSIRIGGLLKYHPIMKSQMDVTLVGVLKEIVEIGVGYRSNEGVLLLSRVKITDQWDFGAQYEIPTTKLYQYKSGTIEVSLIYNGLFKSKAASPRQL